MTENVQLAVDASVPPLKVTDPPPAVAVAVPLQVLLRFGVEATTSPAGNVSVNETPLRPSPLFGFDKAKLKVVVPFSGMLAAPNDLVMLAGEATVRLAVAVLPWPPFTEVTWAVVLVYCPEAAPVTVTLNVHGVPTATVAPESVIALVPKKVCSVPPHTVEVALATVSPVGSVSWNATPVSETVLPVGLVMVNCSDEVPFTAIVEGLNAFAIEGGATTLIGTDVVPPDPPSVDVTALVLLVWLPAAVPVTFTFNEQFAPAASVTPESENVCAPTTAVNVPPQLMLFAPAATARPEDNVSVKPMPLKEIGVGFGFVIVNSSVSTLFSETLPPRLST